MVPSDEDVDAALAEDFDLEEFGEEGLRRNLEDLGWVEAVAVALLERGALGLAVVGEDDDLVGPGRVAPRPCDAAELLVQLAQFQAHAQQFRLFERPAGRMGGAESQRGETGFQIVRQSLQQPHNVPLNGDV